MSKYRNLKKQILSDKRCPKILSNDTTIHISIDASSEILSSFTEDNKPVINSEFASFLDNAVKDEPVKKDLTLEIHSKDNDCKNVDTAIKNYYYNEFIETERKLKSNLRFCIITLIVGLIALAISVSPFQMPSILVGAIDIFAWVFMWEAVDLFFFRRAELKHEQHRQINFINAKIIFK